MGCGSSKSTISPVVENIDVEVEHLIPTDSQFVPKLPSMGKFNHSGDPSQEFSGPTIRQKPIAAPMAFEVPVTDEGESLIRKHPPRRFQRLEDQQVTPNLTHAVLDEKQAEAELRRIQILTQRIQSAKPKPPKKRTFILDSLDQEDDEAIETMKMENSTLEL